MTASRGKFSLGNTVGRAMAKRIIDLSHPDALIVDNSPTVLVERRKPAAAQQQAVTPKRRSTDK